MKVCLTHAIGLPRFRKVAVRRSLNGQQERCTPSDPRMNERLRSVSLLLLGMSISFQAAASVLGKNAAIRMERPTLSAFLTSPWYLGCLACLLVQALCWQLVLREVRLFVAYLVTSLNY